MDSTINYYHGGKMKKLLVCILISLMAVSCASSGGSTSGSKTDNTVYLKSPEKYYDTDPKMPEETKIVLIKNDNFKVVYFPKKEGLLDLPFSAAAVKTILGWIDADKTLPPAQMTILIANAKKAFAKGKYQRIKVGENRFWGRPMKLGKKISIMGDVFIGNKRKGMFSLGLDAKGNPTKNPY